ncbi:MAG: hypothetical protein IPP10_10470 [Candidatus Competibacteraceae bacterium]|nr:hypothetical protein [Candidatus Competibacteraceae bacterium]MBK9951917.1 hypothetical protein [Candidatus Competibacteraceae bacterium]
MPDQRHEFGHQACRSALQIQQANSATLIRLKVVGPSADLDKTQTKTLKNTEY